MRWFVLIAAIIGFFVVAGYFHPEGDEVGVDIEPVSDPFRIRNRPPELGPSWFEAHNEVTGLGASAIVVVVGSLVVAVVDDHRRG